MKNTKSQQREDIKKDLVEILELNNIITKIKSSIDELNI